tara:strand:+ start:24 stop:251 length:228 start_codon:yes stop_codon:yes gene_type:complete
MAEIIYGPAPTARAYAAARSWEPTPSGFTKLDGNKVLLVTSEDALKGLRITHAHVLVDIVPMEIKRQSKGLFQGD